MVRRSLRPPRTCQVFFHRLLTMSTPCTRNVPRWCCTRTRRRCRRRRTSPRERAGRAIQIGTADGPRPRSRGNAADQAPPVRPCPGAPSASAGGSQRCSTRRHPRLGRDRPPPSLKRHHRDRGREASLSIRPATSQTPLAGRISLAGWRTTGSPSGRSAMVPCGPFDHVSGAHWNSPEGGADRLRGDS